MGMNNFELYKSIFLDVFSITEDKLNESFSNDNVENWDSVRHLSLIASIEESFDVMLDTEDILNFTSFELGKIILSDKYNLSF
jgi:acyl carrier protein